MTYTAPNLVKMKLDIKQVRFGIITEALSCQGPAVYATCLDISISHIDKVGAVETPASYITKSSRFQTFLHAYSMTKNLLRLGLDKLSINSEE